MTTKQCRQDYAVALRYQELQLSLLIKETCQAFLKKKTTKKPPLACLPGPQTEAGWENVGTPNTWAREV